MPVTFLSTEACGTPWRIDCSTVVEKSALIHERVKGHPVAVKVGLAHVQTAKLIACSLNMKLKAFSALPNLEAIIS